MNALPLLIDAEEATEYFREHPDCTDAEKAYIVGVLSNEGLTNKQIREALKISKVYTVTHLKRAGTSLSEEELTLWLNNPLRITLGHVRAIAKLPRTKREELLRGLLRTKSSVQKFESIAQGKSDDRDADIKRYEVLMGERLGREIKIRYNQGKRTGCISLDFYTLEDLDHISKQLGFNAEEHF